MRSGSASNSGRLGVCRVPSTDRATTVPEIYAAPSPAPSNRSRTRSSTFRITTRPIASARQLPGEHLGSQLGDLDDHVGGHVRACGGRRRGSPRRSAPHRGNRSSACRGSRTQNSHLTLLVVDLPDPGSAPSLVTSKASAKFSLDQKARHATSSRPFLVDLLGQSRSMITSVLPRPDLLLQRRHADPLRRSPRLRRRKRYPHGLISRIGPVRSSASANSCLV